MIRVQNVCKHFGSVVAVQDVSFTAENGTVTGLLGPNGAGKTTSLRMIYGLIKPDSGSIEVDSHNAVTDPLGAQACLGVLPRSIGTLSAADTARTYPLFWPVTKCFVARTGKAHGNVGSSSSILNLWRTGEWVDSRMANVRRWPWLAR